MKSISKMNPSEFNEFVNTTLNSYRSNITTYKNPTMFYIQGYDYLRSFIEMEDIEDHGDEILDQLIGESIEYIQEKIMTGIFYTNDNEKFKGIK